MVHRDVKPANCLFLDGTLQLSDFGLLTWADPQASRVGTRSYMPPDGRMDARIAESPALCALMRLVLRACQPDPLERFPDARAMLAELDGPGSAPPPRSRRGLLAAIGGAALLAAAAVAFWPSRPPKVHVNFISHPFGATIYLDGALLREADDTPSTTPCTVEGLPARVHHVVFQREGQPARDAGQVDFATTRQITARWEGED